MVGESVGDTVGDIVGDTVGDIVGDTVGDIVGDSVKQHEVLQFAVIKSVPHVAIRGTHTDSGWVSAIRTNPV